MTLSKLSLAVLCLVLLVIGFVFGFLGGFFSHIPDTGNNLDRLQSLTKDADETISRRLIDEVNPENIRHYLKHLTSKPHMAGTPADKETADEIKRFWETEAVLDRVQIYPYDVLLSYPEQDSPNRIVIKDVNDRDLFTTQLYESILDPEQNQSDVVPPFNAFSASGEPKGDLVYVNYARVDDFIWLTESEHIDPNGKICIARYGKVFRGDKVLIAQRYGCLGMILYSDPADYVLLTNAEDVYPDSWFLPGSGVQRGNVKATFAEKYGCIGLILYSDPANYAIDDKDAVYPDSWFLPDSGVQRGTLNMEGDVLTPHYPAIKSAYRWPKNKTSLPRIPVQPIGYDDARVLLSNMTGPEVNPDWRGKLKITYRLGPGFKNRDWKTQMFIKTHTKNVTTYNVLGFIEGAIEPDRYVLLGNHRDAWVFGALDPTSGTAAMMEISRAFGVMLKTGWRPRRTIIFCSWGAEEHGIIGSREWVEYYGKMLSERAVAYINVDIAVQGNFSFRGRTMPLLHQLMFDTAKQIPNPDPDEVSAGRKTVYDTWLYRQPAVDKRGLKTGVPIIQNLGSGSDFAPFVTKAGVTAVDIAYNYDRSLGLSSYPMYHSAYETFRLVETYYDPTFAYHKAIAQYWGELGRRLADEYILPFDVIQYGVSLDGYVQSVIDNYGELMESTRTNTGLGFLKEAVTTFKEASQQFIKDLSTVDTSNPILVRMYNDVMIQIDRMFIDPNGLPGRPFMRNVIFAPSKHNSYTGSTFPGLIDSLYELDRTKTMIEEEEKGEVVKQQIAILTYFIEAAASSLRNILI
ncbi:hypothetical protein LSH36_56g02011 [Paralvinella palmiformis]|uniref:glutamate carboxypeptidase II n=1 Tax=Paralvinella palmiformis TaxID=53620 RepID=A0AAD9K513_9ANNE|nr:hypothetical protein LSH36_56g02011 [Paralvinella palmiformis]